MKQAIIEILEESQCLINRNPDGSVKDPLLTPEALYKKTYQTFESTIGKGFSLKGLEGENSPHQIGHVLSVLLKGGRLGIARSQQAINAEPDGRVKLKKFIPVVFGNLVAERMKKKTGVVIKQVNSGKGPYRRSNKYDQADEGESASLEMFLIPGWRKNAGYGEQIEQTYRYAKPIIIKKDGLVCHGEPLGEKGQYGHPKEGYKVGEVRGAISITLPVKEAEPILFITSAC